MFREQCYQDEGNARQQAARGTYDPAYLNYTMGKLMIRKLRDDWTATRGGRRAWKAFHDAVPELWRPADPAGAQGDAGRRPRGGVLSLLTEAATDLSAGCRRPPPRAAGCGSRGGAGQGCTARR